MGAAVVVECFTDLINPPLISYVVGPLMITKYLASS